MAVPLLSCSDLETEQSRDAPRIALDISKGLHDYSKRFATHPNQREERGVGGLPTVRDTRDATREILSIEWVY